MHFRLLLLLLISCSCYIAHAQTITTVAGNGTFTISGDGGPATDAGIRLPSVVFADNLGNLFITGTSTLRKVDIAGIITTIGGGGTSLLDGIPALSSVLPGVNGLFKDTSENIYVAAGHKVRRIDVTGIIHTKAGTGINAYTGDGGPATNADLLPIGHITFDDTGNLYITHSYSIRKVDTGGIITTFAGINTPGYSGDGAAATAAQFNVGGAIVADHTGNIYFADQGNNCIRKVDAAGIITTIAGNGSPGFSGDGGLATDAQLYGPVGLALDPWGNLYIADVQNDRIRKMDPSGIITTIAGNGVPLYGGDGGPATAASLNKPVSLATNQFGDVYINDLQNYRIRRISTFNRAPYFTHGTLAHLTACGEYNDIDTLLQVIDSNSAQTIVWSVVLPPAHGTLSAAYTTLSTGTILTPDLLSYVPPFGYSGPDTFSVRVWDGGAADTIVIAVDVQVTPVAAPLSGADTICIGSTATYSAATPAGAWSSPDATIGVDATTGTVTGITTGTATLSYTISNACGADTATRTIVILPAGECPTGITALSQADISIYPNPGKGIFTLQLGTPATIVITDITGRTIQQFSANHTSTFSLDVSGGVYILSVRTDSGVWNERLVVR